jgi:hypothetical protein
MNTRPSFYSFISYDEIRDFISYVEKRMKKACNEYNTFDVRNEEDIKDSLIHLETWDRFNKLMSTARVFQGRRELAHSLHSTHLKILDVIDELENICLLNKKENKEE